MIHNYLIIFVILIHLSYVFNLKCTNDTVCNNGVCTSGNCTCNAGYADFKDGTCNYQKKEKLTAFLLSFLIGTTGADWFYLSSGSGNYIAAGIFKLLTGIAGIVLPCAFCCLGLGRASAGKTIGVILLSLVVILATAANGIWCLVDWIRILTNSFKDGNGIELKNW